MTLKTVPEATNWNHLDRELSRWLRVRSTLRAARARQGSPLDDISIALRKVRATLGFVSANASEGDPRVVALVSRAYRWSIRIARELEAIEQLELDAMEDWSRFEAFAPFALAFYDSVLAAPFAATGKTPEVARLRREIDAILSPLATAMTSSAMAA